MVIMEIITIITIIVIINNIININKLVLEISMFVAIIYFISSKGGTCLVYGEGAAHHPVVLPCIAGIMMGSPMCPLG